MGDVKGVGGKRPLAVVALLGVTIIWGATFPWMKGALDVAREELGEEGMLPATSLFLCLRFAISALLLPFCVKGALPRRGEGWGGLAWGLVLGLLFLGGFLLQMVALDELTPAASAFLTSLYVLFTALLSLFFRHHRAIGAGLWIGVLLATGGAAIISGPPQIEFGLAEWMTVASAFLFACTILVTDHATRRHAPAQISWMSFTVVALGAAGILLYFLSASGEASGGGQVGDLWILLGLRGFVQPLLFCSLLATLLALTALNHFQRFVSPVRAATLYSLEPVWAAVISLFLGSENPDFWLFAGASALLSGNLFAEFGGRSPKVTGVR